MCKGGSSNSAYQQGQIIPIPKPPQLLPPVNNTYQKYITTDGFVPTWCQRMWWRLWEAAWCQMSADITPHAHDVPLPFQGRTDVAKHYDLTHKHLSLAPRRLLMLIPLLLFIHRQLTSGFAQKCCYSYNCGSIGNHQILALLLHTSVSYQIPPAILMQLKCPHPTSCPVSGFFFLNKRCISTFMQLKILTCPKHRPSASWRSETEKRTSWTWFT